MPHANQKHYKDFLFLYFYGAMQLDVSKSLKIISVMDTNDSLGHEKGTRSLIPKHSIYVFYHILGPKIRYRQDKTAASDTCVRGLVLLQIWKTLLSQAGGSLLLESA